MNWTTIVGIALWALLPGFIAKKKGRNFWAYYFLSFIITPLITTIITLCLRRVSEELKNAPASSELPISKSISSDLSDGSINIVQDDSTVSQRLEEAYPRKIRYCRRCGNKLIEGSVFCSNCGNEIEKDGEM